MCDCVVITVVVISCMMMVHGHHYCTWYNTSSLYTRNHCQMMYTGTLSPQDRDGDEVGETLDLSRFEPLMAELLDDLVAGKLSQGDYPNIAGTAPPPSTTSSASMLLMG